ncbi:MAG: hypothetical protein WCD57_12935 [Acidobacteriaceae bacterium]
MKRLLQFALLALPLFMESQAVVVLQRDYPPIPKAKTLVYVVRPDGTGGHCIVVSIP